MGTKLTTARDAARSDAGWSEPGEPAPAIARDDHAFAAPDDSRYRELEVVASGGMGTVSIARDDRLRREVAIKRVAIEVEDAESAARLAREAEITARLEHPNIVAVYDAGLAPDGRLFYAMRLIRGRSLGDAARDADAAGRRALLRHFLDVCHAIAYAHERGIVHRDLKPANIMVGEFGETQVVDWGLARELAEAPPAAGVVGTPAYLAPECANGSAGDRTSDVWSLGAILFELLAARRLYEGERDAVLARLAAGAEPRTWPESVPPELRAIVDKALAWQAPDRYADAAELAADVEAFVDGRRVGAHAYSSIELATRLLHAWRFPLGALAAAAVAGVLVLVVTWRRIESERAHAVAAETQTRAALATTRSTLAWALDASAASTLASGAPAEAEVIAAHALAAHESPELRGMLAGLRGGAHATTAVRVVIPGCDRIVADDSRTALCASSGGLASWDVETQRERWSVALTTQAVVGGHGRWVVAWQPGTALVLLDGTTGTTRARFDDVRPKMRLARDPDGRFVVAYDDRSVRVIDAVAGTSAAPARICDTVTIDAVAVGRESVFAVCSDGRVVRAANGSVREVAQVDFARARKPASTAALDADEHRLAIGGIGGEVAIVSLTGEPSIAPRVVLDHAVDVLAFAGDHPVLGGQSGPLQVWSSTLDATLMVLPMRASAGVVVDGTSVITTGAAWWRWVLPAAMPPRVLTSNAGLSGAAVHGDGSLVAVARGDGVLEAWSARDGRRIASTSLATGVIKRVDFSPDGTHLAAAIAQPVRGTAVVDTTSWQPVTHLAAERGVARVAYVASGELVGVNYGDDLFRWSATGERADLSSPVFVDGTRTSDRHTLWLVTGTGEVWRLRDGELARQFVAEGARAVAASDDGAVVATMRDDGVAVRGAGSFAPTRETLMSLAVSADGRWIAAGAANGSVLVWDTHTHALVARLAGHDDRVSWVAFAAGALWTASWDGCVRRWSVDALDAPARVLVADAERAWAMDLDVALGR